MIRFIVLLTTLVLATTGGALAQYAAGSRGIVDVDRIIAIVNDDVIMESELLEYMETVRQRLLQQDTKLPPDHIFRKQALDRLVVQHLQLQMADRSGIRIDDNTLNRTLERIATDNKMTLEDMRTTLEAEGFSFESYREGIRKELILNRLRQREIVNRIIISDREVENFLTINKNPGAEQQDYLLAHILIAVPDGADAEQIQAAHTRAGDIVAQLRDGADFKQMAVAVSDGQQALEGGSLGWRKQTEVPTLFAELVSSMNKGDISDPVRSTSGFHIIKLVDKKGGGHSIVKQTQARHILIRTTEITSDNDARIRLEQLRQRIAGGENFASLARSHSDDTATAIKGGMIGWVNPGDLVPRFEEAMNQLPLGAVSTPFKTQFGWHILQVLDRREHDSTQDFLKSKAREFLHQRKIEEETQAWLRRLRDEAYVEYRLEE